VYPSLIIYSGSVAFMLLVGPAYYGENVAP
jgi:hypothetical protein